MARQDSWVPQEQVSLVLEQVDFWEEKLWSFVYYQLASLTVLPFIQVSEI